MSAYGTKRTFSFFSKRVRFTRKSRHSSERVENSFDQMWSERSMRTQSSLVYLEVPLDKFRIGHDFHKRRTFYGHSLGESAFHFTALGNF